MESRRNGREEGNGYFRERVSGMPAVDSTPPPPLHPYLSPFPIFESLSEPLSQPQALITQNFSDHRAPLPRTIIIAHCHPTINTHTHIEVRTLMLDPPYIRQSDRQYPHQGDTANTNRLESGFIPCFKKTGNKTTSFINSVLTISIQSSDWISI